MSDKDVVTLLAVVSDRNRDLKRVEAELHQALTVHAKLNDLCSALEAENRALKVRNEWLEVYTVTPRVSDRG